MFFSSQLRICAKKIFKNEEEKKKRLTIFKDFIQKSELYYLVLKIYNYNNFFDSFLNLLNHSKEKMYSVNNYTLCNILIHCFIVFIIKKETIMIPIVKNINQQSFGISFYSCLIIISKRKRKSY